MRAHTDVLSGWALSGALFSLLLFLKNNNNNKKKPPKTKPKKKPQLSSPNQHLCAHPSLPHCLGTVGGPSSGCLTWKRSCLLKPANSRTPPSPGLRGSRAPPAGDGKADLPRYSLPEPRSVGNGRFPYCSHREQQRESSLLLR